MLGIGLTAVEKTGRRIEQKPFRESLVPWLNSGEGMQMTDQRRDLLRSIRHALDFSPKGRGILVSRVLLEAVAKELDTPHPNADKD